MIQAHFQAYMHVGSQRTDECNQTKQCMANLNNDLIRIWQRIMKKHVHTNTQIPTSMYFSQVKQCHAAHTFLFYPSLVAICPILIMCYSLGLANDREKEKTCSYILHFDYGCLFAIGLPSTSSSIIHTYVNINYLLISLPFSYVNDIHPFLHFYPASPFSSICT